MFLKILHFFNVLFISTLQIVKDIFENEFCELNSTVCTP